MPNEDAIPIVNQILVLVGVCDHLSGQLQRPVRRRMRGHVHVRQTARAVLDDDEHVQHPERNSDGYEEVARNDRLGVISQERRPAPISKELSGHA